MVHPAWVNSREPCPTTVPWGRVIMRTVTRVAFRTSMRRMGLGRSPTVDREGCAGTIREGLTPSGEQTPRSRCCGLFSRRRDAPKSTVDVAPDGPNFEPPVLDGFGRIRDRFPSEKAPNTEASVSAAVTSCIENPALRKRASMQSGPCNSSGRCSSKLWFATQSLTAP